MAAEIPTFKLVLVGDGGTGMREERRCIMMGMRLTMLCYRQDDIRQEVRADGLAFLGDCAMD